MRDRLILLVVLLMILLFLIFGHWGDSRVRVYDCGMAEWHPDIPTDVRDECRKLRQEQFQIERKSISI